ncbi:unnamed protein product [Alopecurus aequalis]
MVAAVTTWKTRFRELVVHAEGRCRRRTAWKIDYARAYLVAPMHAAAADDVRTILQLAEQALENASSDLADAISSLRSAKELARRGGTGDPSDAIALPRILGLLDITAVQRTVSRNVRDARMLAIEAYHAMELCCDSLLSLRHLLDYPLLPSVDDAIDGQRVEAYELLVSAKDKVDRCAVLAVRAREDVSGAAD